MKTCVQVILGSICFVTVATSVRADEPVDYLRQIKPFLQERCFACHGTLKQKGGLRLDTVAFTIKGGDTGSAIDLKSADKSLLLERVSAAEEKDRMPPEGEPLHANQIKLLKQWITEGAKAPANDVPEKDAREHWAFQAPIKPNVPKTNDPAWNKNPIDAFLSQEYARLNLKHQPRADKRIWLRRVYFDLIGLPPTLAETDQFLNDQSPNASEKVVDQLLARPEYGERWGRHWMDVWRYSDWWGLGAEVRNSQKHIWHWRDWIIESVNADKGYDQMLREMLAADELYPTDSDKLRATGFLARQYFKFNRTSWMDETIEHTSKAMLGLTINCSKCHDHKYDPISQAEYYRLRAIFEPYQIRTDFVSGEVDPEKDGIPRAFDCNLETPTYRFIRGDDRQPDKNKVMEPGVPGVLSLPDWKIAAINLPAEAYQPGLKPAVLKTYLTNADKRILESRQSLEKARKDFAALPADVPVPKKIDEPASKPTSSTVLVEDRFDKDRPELWKQVSGKWTYQSGKLVQSQDGSVRGLLQLKQKPPQDFEVTFKFQTTAGQMWKSVGIIFDQVGETENLVYMSAVNGGSKAQIAYKKGGDYVYPQEALQSRPVELKKPYEMTLRVRGQLVNFLIDGQLAVAYRLPVERKQGNVLLNTFDAQAEFFNFTLKELSPTVELAEAKSQKPVNSVPVTKTQAEVMVRIAEKELAIAELQPAVLKARFAAELAKNQQPAPANAKDLAQDAAKQERLVSVANAELAVLKLEQELARANPTEKKAVEPKLKSAQTTLENARKALTQPGDQYTPLVGALKTLESNIESEDSRRKPFPKTSTGRRTAFAQWLTNRNNPLPARVAINHIWLRHMGRPLVPTIFDFGRKGTPPTHPQLLDWLAVEMMDHGWSMKHIHKLIVTSEAYQMTSSSLAVDPETKAKDPDNRFYWRANPIRMEAQLVRDSLLSLAGELDLTKGGPTIPANDDQSRRRSLYYFHSHNEHHKFLSIFDDANVLDCYRRAESIVPQQGLALENSPLATTMADRIAQRIAKEHPKLSDEEFAKTAFRIILSVDPNPEELSATLEGLNQMARSAKELKRPDPSSHARGALIQVLLNHNDFITIR